MNGNLIAGAMQLSDSGGECLAGAQRITTIRRIAIAETKIRLAQMAGIALDGPVLQKLDGAGLEQRRVEHFNRLASLLGRSGRSHRDDAKLDNPETHGSDQVL